MALASVEKDTCVEEFKEKVEHLILFHMYELEVQAEDLLVQGRVDFTRVVDLEVFIENKKALIEKASSVKEWKIVVWQVQEDWLSFTKGVQ